MITIWTDNSKQVNEKSEELVEFFLENSRNVVLTRRHTGTVPADILQEMAAAKIQEVEQRCKRQLEYAKTISKKELKRNCLKDRASLEEIFRRQAAEQIQEVRKMTGEYAGEKDALEEALSAQGMVKREYSFGAFFTWPDLWDICYFPKDVVNLAGHRKCFFGDAPLIVGDYEFEDIGFENDQGMTWVKTCLHEGELSMTLTEKQLAQFEKLKIDYHMGG